MGVRPVRQALSAAKSADHHDTDGPPMRYIEYDQLRAQELVRSCRLALWVLETTSAQIPGASGTLFAARRAQ